MKLLSSVRRFFGGEPRKRAQFVARMQRAMASFDAARPLDEFANYWVNADRFDADSAHSKEVRHTLLSRARYEVSNNGYADGIAQTYANDLVGVGPSLRMQTGSTPFNQMVEREWFLWSQAVGLRRKLWSMCHAKHVDGEAFAILRRNNNIPHPVNIDLVLHEAEQIQTPYPPFDDPNYIDGIKFDRFGNAVWYDVLNQHPGTSRGLVLDPEPERVPARFVLHWYKMRRPGQHRGVAEMASTLNLGAAARRFREANVLTAEKIARWAVLLKSLFEPEEFDEVDPMTAFELVSGMITMLPNTVDPVQLRAEHPSPQYDTFVKLLINEQARPKNMPYNKAACDSSSYNYASGRLDHQTYYAGLDVEREDANDAVLDPLFRQWLDAAILRFGWLGGNPDAVGAGARFHAWDWPKHRVADVEAEANANETRIKSGQIGLHRLYSDAGLDLEDELDAMAETFGVSVDDLRERLLNVLLPSGDGTATPPRSGPDDVLGASLAAAFRRGAERELNRHTNGHTVKG